MHLNIPYRILVVDDDALVCKALQRTLAYEGYTLFFAHDPIEALCLLTNTPVDAVISDHRMPTMTGLEFLKIVRDRHPDCVRMMLTGHADLQTIIDAVNHGAIDRFIRKPWDEAELKVTLHLALDRLQLERENRRVLAMARCRGVVRLPEKVAVPSQAHGLAAA